MRDSGEVAAYIAARWGVVYGHSGCVALLHRLGFEDKRPESLPARSDEAKQAAFISRYDQLLNGLVVRLRGGPPCPAPDDFRVSHHLKWSLSLCLRF